MVGATGEQLQQSARSNRTILVVEDEVLVRMMIADQLRNAGYTVFEVADADQALALLAHTYDVQVVLTDIQMPGSRDGLGLAHIVRCKYPDIKILLTSGHCREVGDIDHDGFFSKPYDVTKIVSHIETFFD
jgi:CheY-like chemotaxis protein